MLQCRGSNSRSTFSFLFSSMTTAAMDEPNSAAASPSVDCTLSLGPPSARNSTITTAPRSSPPSSLVGPDPHLLARRCANCDTTSTPLWRNGPRGPKSLCNACGIRYKKEERRASASTTSPAPTSHPMQHHHPWMTSPASTKRAGWCQHDHHEQEMTDQMPSYLSWRLNLVPPP